MSPIIVATYENNFQIISKLLLKWAEKKPEQADEYLRAIKEMYFAFNTLSIELRETELKNKCENESLYKRLNALNEQNKILKQKLENYEI